MCKKTLLIISILLLTVASFAQSPDEQYAQVFSWNSQHAYNNVVKWYESQPVYIEQTFTGDSLSWLRYFTSIGYTKRGSIKKASDVIHPVLINLKAVSNRDLKLKLLLHSANLCRQQANYQESIRLSIHIVTILNAELEQYTIEGDSIAYHRAKEQLTKAFINKSIAHFYIGQLEEYGTLNRHALTLAIQNSTARMDAEFAANTHKQQLIARRNLIEYFEITEQWDSVDVHLAQYAAVVKNSGNTVESIRYKLRRAVYQKEQLQQTDESTQLLWEVTRTADSLHAFDIWEDAVYELLNNLFISNKHQEVAQLLAHCKTHPMVLANANALATITARELNLYMITGQMPRAKSAYTSLQVINMEGIRPETEALVTSASIMYLTQTEDMSTARLLLQKLLNAALQTEESGKHSTKDITYQIATRYNQLKTKPNGEERSHQEIITLLLNEYKHLKIRDWVFTASQKTIHWWFILASSVFIIITISQFFSRRAHPQQAKTLGSAAYQQLQVEISRIESEFLDKIK